MIGPSAPRLQDIHETPVDALMPGGEIQSNAIATVLRGLPLQRARATALTVVLDPPAVVAGPGALARQHAPVISLPSAFLVAVLFVVAVQLAFNHGRIVSFVYPLTALALSTIGSLAVQIVMTAFEREQVRDVFTRFVPESVVDRGAEADGQRPPPRRRRGRGHRALHRPARVHDRLRAPLPPRRCSTLINRHLEEIVGAVLDHGGTLVSYTGDGIIAVFGAPIEQEDHAQRAFDAAARSSPSGCPAGTSGWPRRACRAASGWGSA